MTDQKNTPPNEKEIINSVTLPMPGTIGGATLVFKDNEVTIEEEEAFNMLNAKLNKNKEQ